ncbi:MAG: hypothetical protein FWE31_06070, partial [Firmicutes bacterium]|nr:hypothetical protein [Bacillota bacterium]
VTNAGVLTWTTTAMDESMEDLFSIFDEMDDEDFDFGDFTWPTGTQRVTAFGYEVRVGTGSNARFLEVPRFAIGAANATAASYNLAEAIDSPMWQTTAITAAQIRAEVDGEEYEVVTGELELTGEQAVAVRRMQMTVSINWNSLSTIFTALSNIDFEAEDFDFEDLMELLEEMEEAIFEALSVGSIRFSSWTTATGTWTIAA